MYRTLIPACPFFVIKSVGADTNCAEAQGSNKAAATAKTFEYRAIVAHKSLAKILIGGERKIQGTIAENFTLLR